MKALNFPPVNDDANLTAMAAQAHLDTHPELNQHLQPILVQYALYLAANGDLTADNVPQAIDLPANLVTALKYYYNKPPVVLGNYLDTLRDRVSPSVCPMCGSLKTGTLDHIFPQAVFAEFVLFSWNLVPACDCNSLRSRDLRGPNPGERVLHPYFDASLNRRLVRAAIAPGAGGYRTPVITLLPAIQPADPLYPTVNYHLNNVILRTRVLFVLDDNWVQILRFPESFFTLPNGNFTYDDLSQAIQKAVLDSDNKRSTPNNWDSMLLEGLSVNAAAKRYLESVIRQLRAGTITPDQI